jgi:hypothetical protein
MDGNKLQIKEISMTTIKTKRGMVDVADAGCGEHLPCFAIGEDKGTYMQGRGYTSYHSKPQLVCWTRHLQGCPTVWSCIPCRRIWGAYSDEICPICKGVMEKIEQEDSEEWNEHS